MKPTLEFDPVRTSRKVLREARMGGLATLTGDSGDPFSSLVSVATAADGSPLLLLSRLAIHTQNILRDSRASLMLNEHGSPDPLQAARITLSGRASTTDDPEARRRYLDRYPSAALFVDFKDFNFYHLEIARIHLVAGFGRIVDFGASDLLLDLAGADALVKAEADICEHMNADHKDALRLYATQLLGAPDGDWVCAGCDPEGLELQHGSQAVRLLFPRRIETPGVLRQVLKQMVEEARSVQRSKDR